MQDVARDNRWGRYYETWSEEPALAAAMGGAYVRGVQSGGSGGLKVTATVKHFAGYSESINGHDRVQAELPLRYLQDTFLPSYAGAINAGAGTVMAVTLAQPAAAAARRPAPPVTGTPPGRRPRFAVS